MIVNASEPIPRVNVYGAGPYVILILAGTHGNEPGPSVCLMDWTPSETSWYNPLDYTVYVVPAVNSVAIKYNRRAIFTDINRSWPKSFNTSAKHPINKFLIPYIKSANMIIDFHEAWGKHKCQNNTLGQTIYSHNIDARHIVNCLNQHEMDKCSEWSHINKLPYTGGALDELCLRENKNYFLIEIAGQDNIQTIAKRINTTRLVLESIQN
jgi:predicted deacylase